MWIAYTPDGGLRRPYRSLGPAAAYLLMALVDLPHRAIKSSRWSL